ncbi:643_t:CDS:2, partial [Entrophospora sp. SA101]
GESAKANALAGLEIANNKKWGVHFLQGKLLNVRDATVQQVAQNEEVQALMKVFGLEQDTFPADSSTPAARCSMMAVVLYTVFVPTLFEVFLKWHQQGTEIYV